MAKYINVSYVKKYIKSNGRRTGQGFITMLDAHIQKKLEQAVACHNGGKETLDASVAGYVGLT